MTSIINIGMDVHITNYTVCAFTMEGQKAFAQTTLNPELGELEKYPATLNAQLGGSCHFVCGYEAGCLGYSLYHQITRHNGKGFKAECVILAPTTMPRSGKDAVKTDKRDARKIAQCWRNISLPVPSYPKRWNGWTTGLPNWLRAADMRKRFAS